MVTEEEDKVEELNTIKKALSICGYPKWTSTKIEKDRNNTKEEKKGKKEESEKSRGMIVLPYVKGTSEKMMRVLRKHRFATAMKPHTTLRRLLVHPKDKLEAGDGVYSIDCKNCSGKYIGETKRKLNTRVKEHRDEAEKVGSSLPFTRANRKQSQSQQWSSAITDHTVQNNHIMDWDSARIVQKESDWRTRGIIEALWIRKTRTNINRDEGRHHLTHLYDDLLEPHPRD
mgnify:CR=1 FL=1